jgi:menaquinone-dependent protoporphyrinogen oxidase
MRVLVTAASKHEATAEIAAALGKALGAAGADATVLAPDEVHDLDAYDAVVLGSAVYAGHWLAPAKAFVERLGSALATRPVWLFSSGPVGRPARPDEDPADVPGLMATTGAREHRVLPGRVERQRLGFAERAVVTALRVPDGDFRDWAAVDGFAHDIARELAAAAST